MTPDCELRITQRIGEGPRVRASKLSGVRLRDLGIRFAAGAATSVVAGLLTLALGPRAGGIMLAFPAILAASLTLIEEEDDSAEAREDSRGAVLGGVALAAFAGVASIALPSLAGALALGVALAAWIAVAVGGYFVLWR